MRPTAAICMFSVLAVAGAAPAAPVAEVVPYSGFLDRDGTPADGAVALRFRIYNDAALPAAPENDACNGGAIGCVWAEVHEGVVVHNGAFAVRLGAAPGEARRPIAATLRGRTQLYLEVGVRNEADQRWVVLGRQSISPAPQAMFSLQPDIEVGTLNVLGEAQAETLRVRKIGNPGLFAIHDPAAVIGDAGGTHLGLAGTGLNARAGGAPTTLYLNMGATTQASTISADTVNAGNLTASTLRFPSGNAMSNIRVEEYSAAGGCCARDLRPLRNSMCVLSGYGARDMGDDAGQACDIVQEGGNWKLYFSSYDANRGVTCRVNCLVWE